MKDDFILLCTHSMHSPRMRVGPKTITMKTFGVAETGLLEAGCHSSLLMLVSYYVVHRK